jgi:hypothetical protein
LNAGPVDAAFKAIDSLVRVDAELIDYSVETSREGSHSSITTFVTIKPFDLSREGSSGGPQGGNGKLKITFSGGWRGRFKQV